MSVKENSAIEDNPATGEVSTSVSDDNNDAKKPRNTNRVTEVEKRKILEDFAKGDTSIRKLAAKYERSTRTIHQVIKGAQKDQPNEKAANLDSSSSPDYLRQKAAESAAKKEAVEQKALNIDRIRATKESHYKVAEFIPKAIAQVLIGVVRAKKSYASVKNEMQALKAAAEAAKVSREEAYRILQVEKYEALEEQDQLPILEIRQLDDAAIRQMVADQAVQDDLGDGLDLEDVFEENEDDEDVVVEDGYEGSEEVADEAKDVVMVTTKGSPNRLRYSDADAIKESA